MKNLTLTFLLLAISMSLYAQDVRKRGDKIVVPISLDISADDVSVVNIHASIYSNQILDELNKSQDVSFVLVKSDQNPEISIEVGVANLKIGQRTQRSNNTPDANGRSITRTTTVIVEEVIVNRNSSATFNVAIKSRNDSSYLAEKKFNSLYNYSQSTVVSPGSVSIRSKNSLAPRILPEPKFEEFLFLLSKKDLTPYLASELRKVFDNRVSTARIN
jgi:hypothetical protein